DQILLGRHDHAILCLLSCPGSQAFHIFPRIGVMVRKDAEVPDIGFLVEQRLAEGFRIADPAKRCDAISTQVLERRLLLAVDKAYRPMARLHDRDAGRHALDSLAQLPAPGRVYLITPRERDHAGATQTGGGLT